MASTKPVPTTRPRGVRRIIFLIIVAVILMAGAMGSFFYIQNSVAVNQAWLDQRLELKASIDLLTKVSREASQGLEPDFRALTDLTVKSEEGARDFSSLIATFKTGDDTSGMRPLPGEFQEDVDELQAVWTENQSSIQGILANAEVYQRTTSNIAVILDAAGIVSQSYEQLPADRVVSNQLLRLERMASGAQPHRPRRRRGRRHCGAAQAGE